MANNQMHLPTPRSEREATAPDPQTPRRRELARQARLKGTLPAGRSTASLSTEHLESLARPSSFTWKDLLLGGVMQ